MKKTHYRKEESKGFPECGGRGFSENILTTSIVEEVTCLSCIARIELVKSWGFKYD